MRIVLNVVLAKLKGTGGFNLAVDFFQKTLDDKENEWFYFVSEEFHEVVRGRDRGLDERHYYVFHSQPDIRSHFKDKPRIQRAEEVIKPDVIFSILAPSYYKFNSPEVMLCANAWTVVGGVNKYALKVTPFKLKIRYLIKFWVTRIQMRNTSYFITQTSIAKQCILRTVKTSPENVCVVTNILPEYYQKTDVKKISHGEYHMVYASSPAVHKDYLLLPQVASILIDKYGLKDFKIHVTVPDHCNSLFKRYLDQYHVNDCFIIHGFLDQDELIRCYLQCDLGLFPSLLETFSGTLLEYMHFHLPIIASDFDFNREVAEDAALYFEPHNASDMALKIFQVYSNDALRQSLLDKAKGRLALYNRSVDKYAETVAFLRRVAYHEI